MRNKLFVRDDCPFSAAGKAFLDQHAPVYVEYNISRDERALRLLVALVGRTDVPVLIAGYNAEIGFDEQRWAAAIAHGKEIEAFDPYRLPAALGRDPHDDE